MLKPYSILFYFLSIILFFFLGLTYAGLIEAGKGQMLAAGAIVLGYGVLGAGFGLLLSLIGASKLNRNVIVKLNVVFALLILSFVGYFQSKYKKKLEERQEQQQEIDDLNKKRTKPVAPINNKILQGRVPSFKSTSIERLPMYMDAISNLGMGIFSANIMQNATLLFYNGLGRTVVDSVEFGQDDYGNPIIKTAPAYLVPEYMKMDYGILNFKVVSITRDLLEIEVNKMNSKTTWVGREQGQFLFWSDFLLGVHSVEFLTLDGELKVKPLTFAGEVTLKYDFMIPKRIKGDWMLVELVLENYKVVGEAWLQWKKDEELTVKYNLLS